MCYFLYLLLWSRVGSLRLSRGDKQPTQFSLFTALKLLPPGLRKKKPKLVFASCKNALPLLITRVVKRKFNCSKADRQADLRLFDAPRNCVFLAKNLTVELGGACRSSF
jgi:hypothetical protein